MKKIFQRYFIDAMSAMAMGLFASLVIGVVLSQFAKLSFLAWLEPFVAMVDVTSPVVGAAIGVAVAYGLKSKGLVLFSSAAAGAVGYSMGGPVGAYLSAVVSAELGTLVQGKTPVDIVLVPSVCLISGGLAGTLVGPYISQAMAWLGSVVNQATQLMPVPMGVAVSAIMGILLTAPVSSAAISISLGLSGIAAGAAAVGCSTQMVGFAVASYRENKLGGLLSQGLGTSMLQMGNILRKPVIWLPPTLASAILGPISTAVLGMTNTAVGAGMGTSGLVGQFAAWGVMTQTQAPALVLAQILVMHFAAPAALTLLFSELLRKWGWIRPGDMKLQAIK